MMMRMRKGESRESLFGSDLEVGSGRTDERMDGRTNGRTNESPHSTGLRPLSGPLPKNGRERLVWV